MNFGSCIIMDRESWIMCLYPYGLCTLDRLFMSVLWIDYYVSIVLDRVFHLSWIAYFGSDPRL